MIEEIKQLKAQKKALILAHNYQRPEIQELADFVGDSLALAQRGKETDAELIVVCGVQFMAETAKILSPHKKVLLSAADAGCPMADMVTATQLKEYKAGHPDTYVVAYVNTSAEVKAESDICITSSNAIKIIKQLDAQEFLLLPDKNLGAYIKQSFPNKSFDLWRGFCCTHEFLLEADLLRVKHAHKNVKVLLHPECNPKVLKHGDFIGSTFQIIQYAKTSPEQEFIIGTEEGIFHQLKKDSPDKTFYLASQKMVCKNMKKTTLEVLHDTLFHENNAIEIEEEIRVKAVKSLELMLSLS